MGTQSRFSDERDWEGQFFRLKTYRRSRDLYTRIRTRPEFQRYVTNRLWLVIPTIVIALFVSLVCTAATFVFMGKIHSWLILPAIFIAPFILVGSAFVQLFVLFHWFEGRALVQTINRRAKPATRVRMPSSQRKPGLQMGPVPPVPWILATIVLVGPLAMLAHFAWHVALAVLLLIILIPVLYAYIDR